MYDITFHERARRQLEKLPSIIQFRILNTFRENKGASTPFFLKTFWETLLQNKDWEYRAILDIQNKQLIIIVIKIGHRRKIYK